MLKRRDEEHHQVALVDWFRKQYPKYANLLTLGSIGENVGSRRMARLKQMGLTPGYPDLFFALPKKIEHHKFDRHLGEGIKEFIEVEFFAGLFIEMKSEKGIVSSHQKEIHELLRKHHYKVEVAYDWEEAKQIIENYLA